MGKTQYVGTVKTYNIRPYFNYVPTGKKPMAITYTIDKNGCWVCNSHAVNKDGYHKMSRGGKDALVFKEVYKDFYKVDLPKFTLLMHMCDNRGCINPEHMRVGTPAMNSADMVSKNRQAKGSKDGMSKLTENDVILIKKHLMHRFQGLQIARLFGVHSTTIYSIIHGKTWAHI